MRTLPLCLALALSLGACSSDEDAGWEPVVRDDLVVAAEVTGELEAIDSSPIKPPPIPDKWDFKIARMADEGSDVKAGEMVVAFDASDLESELMTMTNEAEAAAKQVEKKRNDAAMARKEEQLAIAVAEANQRKAALKADQPAELVASIELKTAAIDLEVAEVELTHARDRAKRAARNDAAELQSLTDKLEYANSRVAQLEASIATMSVTAPRDGTVICPDNWRGEKKKVGDSAWRMETILLIVSLDSMRGAGVVDEVDSARVAEGQTVTLRLDAYPDEELTGRVKSLGNNVQRRSSTDPSKVVSLDIEITDKGELSLRPGMRFRGVVETDRYKNVVVVPVEAVFVTTRGPVAYRQTSGGYETVALELGRRSATHVEVLSGLEPGNWVSRTDLSVKGSN